MESVNVLKPLQVATTALCESQIVSVSLVYPVINGLINKQLFASSDDLPQLKAFKEKVSAEIKCRFTPESLEIEDNAPLLAAAIDPKYHQLNILSDTQRSIIHDALKEKAEMMLSPDETEDIEQKTSLSPCYFGASGKGIFHCWTTHQPAEVQPITR